MKMYFANIWKRICSWFREPDLDLEEFEALESKKVIRKGVRFYGHD